MSDITYYIDEQQVSAEFFREEQDRSDAEEYLLAAYREAIGDIKCQEHQAPAAYALHYETKTGECRIRTVACCAAFDNTMNMALMMMFSQDPDS